MNPNMTSPFARNGALSQQTMEAYNRFGRSPRNVNERLEFYTWYLQDVAPLGLTVSHVPVEEQRDEFWDVIREEIQLCTTSGLIFMSGLVSLEYHHTHLERNAGDGAYAQWQDGDFVPDQDNWRFFTGQFKIKFFNSYQGEEWEMAGEYHPIIHVEEVAVFLQQEYDKLEHRE